ncbi:MAG: insulinase family protein [Clostridiales bacterium]|jgi:predicted Zn-dependent peptidase|nr:insulinase family protein [Clostridiales bacterium]
MYERYSLTNGIKVIAESIPYVNSISMGIWIRSGSRYENLANNGISHFIEHMLFKGTEKRNAKQIAEEIEELGGQINAFTGKEATCYYVKLLDEHIDIGIDVLSDIVHNSRFSMEDISKEKSVIQEEINMYEDSPEDLVLDLLSLATWGEDSLSFPILGTDKSINNINREVLQKYLESAYAPENIVISIAGNYNSQQVRGKLEKCFGMENSRKNEVIILTTPSIHSNILVKNKDIEQTHVALTLRGIELGNEKLYTLLAINNYFGGNTSSKLFQNLREDKGYVYTIYSYPSAYLNIGMFNIYFALNGQYLDSAIELIKEEIHSILINKMTDIEIKKAKEQLKGNYILGLESVSSRMFGIGKSELMLQKVHEPKEILTQIDNISREDVFEVIDFIFGNGILSAAAVGRNINEDRFKNLLGR